MLKLVEGHYRSLESALPEEVETALGKGSTALVTAGTALQRRILEVLQSTGRKILPGLETIPGFPQLAARLSSKPLLRETVAASDRVLFAMEAMKRIPAGMPYSSLAGVPHAAQALAAFFENELLDRGIDPDTYDLSSSNAGGTETVRAVHIAFKHYHNLRRPLYPGTPDELISSIGKEPGDRFKTIILFGFLDLNPLQRRLLVSLLDSGRHVVFFCPVPLAAVEWIGIGGPTRALLEKYARENLRPDRSTLPPPFLSFADALLGGRIREIPRGFRIVGAPGPAGVARAVMKEIARMRAEGICSSSIAAVGEGPAFGAVESMFRMEGVLTSRPGKVPVSSLPVSALLKNLCRLSFRDYHHSILSAMAGCGILHDHLSITPDEIGRAIRVVGFRKGRVLLERVAGLEKEEYGTARRFAGALMDADLRIPKESGPTELLQALCDAASMLVPPEGHETAILAALPSLARIKSRGVITRSRLADLLDIILEEIQLETPGTPGEVDLLDFNDARGTCYRGVILFGLEEDVFPGVSRSDPRLPDELRKKLELAPRRLRELEQALLFRQAAECAGERLVFVRMTTDSTGREVSWSPFIGALVEDSRDTKAVRAGLDADTIPSDPEQVFFGGSIPCHEDLHRAAEGEFPLHRPFFAEAYEAEGSRLDFHSPFGIHDGMTGRDTGPAREVYSPSALEKWAECPFLYLARNVWKLEEPVDAAMLSSPPANISGSVIHAAVAECLRTPGRAAREALEESSRKNGLDELLGHAALTRVFIEASLPVVEGVLSFLEREGLKPDGGDSIEARHEAAIALAGRKLGGKIDMILRLGGERVILDLKTGRSESLKSLEQRIDSGASMQIPIYAAVLDTKGLPVDRAGLLFSSMPSLEVTFEGEELERVVGVAVSKASKIIELIEGGFFPPAGGADPGRETCRNCGMKSLCRKTPDERLPGKLAATAGLEDVQSLWLKNAEGDPGDESE